MLQKPDVVGHFMGAGCNPCKDVKHTGIHLPGIRLAGHGVALLKAHFFCYHGVNLVNGFLVPRKQLLKACLRPGGPFGA